MALSAIDRDILIRTMAGSDDPTEQENIARKVLASTSDVHSAVLERGRFPQWDTRSRELRSLDRNSDRYKTAASVFDRIAAADTPWMSTKFRTGIKEVAKPSGGSWVASPYRSSTELAPGTIQVPGGAVQAGGPIAAEPFVSPVPSFARQSVERFAGGIARDVPRIAAGIAATPGNIIQSMVEQGRAGMEATGLGARQIRAGDVFPSFPSSDPSTWTLGGGLRVPAGIAGTVFSPLTALSENLVEAPITQLTGNPQAGQTAGLLANVPPSSWLLSRARAAMPRTQALSTLAETVNAAQPQALLDRLRANPRLTLADVDPTLRQHAMGIAVEPGPAKNLLFGRVQQRIETAPGSVREAYSSGFGPAPNVNDTLTGYMRTAKENASRGFGEAFRDAKPVDVSPVIKAIDDKLSPGISGVATEGPTTLAYGPLQHRLADLRSKFTEGDAVVTDPNRLHEIQSELGREVRDLTSSATGSDRWLGRELGKVQDKLVDQIDTAAAGKYKPARAQYRSDMDVQDAFEKGTTLLQARPSMKGLLEDTPEAWRTWRDQATPQELNAARLGARAMIEQKIGGLRNAARQGIALPESDFNFEKFRVLFGDAEAHRLRQLMRDERDIANTNQKLFEGSATAERLVGREAAKVREVQPWSYSGLIPPFLAEVGGQLAGPLMGLGPEAGHAAALGMAGLTAARAMAQRVGRAADIRRNVHAANILTATGAERENAIEQLMRTIREQNRPISRPTVPFTAPLYLPRNENQGR
jgi:hypothetical protein